MSLDISTTPNQIDIGVDDFTSLKRENGKVRREFSKMKGIFEIRKHPTAPTKDKLKWCFAMPGKPRPENFSVAPGSDSKLVEFERFILDEKDAAEKLRFAGADVTLNRAHNWIESLALKTSGDPKAPLEEIRKLRKLKTLHLDAANSRIARAISGHVALRFIHFDCEIAPVVLQEVLVALPNIHEVFFKCSNFSREHGEAFAKSKSDFLSLKLSGNDHDLKGLSAIGNAQIYKLGIRESRLNKSCFKKISDMKHLRLLELNCVTVKAEDLSPLRDSDSLQYLVLYNCGLTEEEIRSKVKFDKKLDLVVSN